VDTYSSSGPEISLAPLRRGSSLQPNFKASKQPRFAVGVSVQA
jgi:hypothetical protein